VSARKIGFLVLILVFGGVVEIAWHVREHHFADPEGIRVLGGRFYGPSFAFEDSAERVVEVDGALEVEVRNAFGDVRVLPGEGPGVQVKLRKVVFQPTEEKARVFADRVELRLEDEDGRLRVGTNRDDVGRDENVGFETHLELHVPADAEAMIWNDHGGVEASGIARAYVRASFGDVRVERIAGPAQIDARQGAVGAVDLGGELTLKSRHGDVEVVGIAGPADLDVQHGKLTARRTGAVEAKVSHGFVAADAVEGDLRVEARHAGARITDVSGGVEIQTSYESVRLERIGGSVRARADRGAVRAKDVKGALTAESTGDGVWLDGIGGRVEVTTRRGGVTAENLGGEVQVRARGDDVSIVGFRGPVDVETEDGDVVLTTRIPITEAVTVSAKEGEVRLDVPAGSRIDLETESRGGELHLDVPELDHSEADTPGRATGTIGGGGALVKLTADGDVTLAASPTARPAEKP
jgi:DUF4097 and DUF4098 domain-containing protein YvlB